MKGQQIEIDDENVAINWSALNRRGAGKRLDLFCSPRTLLDHTTEFEMKVTTLLLILGIFAANADGGRDSQDARGSTAASIAVTVYDPARNPEQDLRDAVAEARRSEKRILLDVGGEWCIWCHRLDAFFEANAQLLALRNKKFIVLKINVSPKNSNKKFLSHYPAMPGYPHLFVLDANGKLLHSESTGTFELGSSYSLQRIETFLKRWASQSR